LGQLQAKLVELGLDTSTDLIVVSDHGHSIVAGDPTVFPLRGIDSPDGGAGVVGAIDPQGYLVSDGVGCTRDPVMSGIKQSGDRLYPEQTDDATGSTCGKGGAKYNTGSFVVPSTLPADAVVI